MHPSYIRVCVVVWAYGRGQTDTQTHTHRQADTQTRVTTIHFASSMTHAKCNRPKEDGTNPTQISPEQRPVNQKRFVFLCVFGANGQGRNVLMLVGVGDAVS